MPRRVAIPVQIVVAVCSVLGAVTQVRAERDFWAWVPPHEGASPSLRVEIPTGFELTFAPQFGQAAHKRQLWVSRDYHDHDSRNIVQSGDGEWVDGPNRPQKASWDSEHGPLAAVLRNTEPHKTMTLWVDPQFNSGQWHDFPNDPKVLQRDELNQVRDVRLAFDEGADADDIVLSLQWRPVRPNSPPNPLPPTTNCVVLKVVFQDAQHPAAPLVALLRQDCATSLPIFGTAQELLVVLDTSPGQNVRDCVERTLKAKQDDYAIVWFMLQSQ